MLITQIKKYNNRRNNLNSNLYYLSKYKKSLKLYQKKINNMKPNYKIFLSLQMLIRNNKNKKYHPKAHIFHKIITIKNSIIISSLNYK